MQICIQKAAHFNWMHCKYLNNCLLKFFDREENHAKNPKQVKFSHIENGFLLFILQIMHPYAAFQFDQLLTDPLCIWRRNPIFFQIFDAFYPTIHAKLSEKISFSTPFSPESFREGQGEKRPNTQRILI